MISLFQVHDVMCFSKELQWRMQMKYPTSWTSSLAKQENIYYIISMFSLFLFYTLIIYSSHYAVL